MQRLWTFIALIALSATAFADNTHLLEELDSAITQRSHFISKKKEKIDFITKRLKAETDSIATLKYIDDLYSEYYVFKFDSAMTYAKRGLARHQAGKPTLYDPFYHTPGRNPCYGRTLQRGRRIFRPHESLAD